MEKFIKGHAFWFTLLIFFITLIIPLPFVGLYKVLGLNTEHLRLIIPIVESLFILGLLWKVGWLRKSGFGTRIKDIHLLWMPLLLVFIPISYFGTVKIDAGPMLFYILAIFFTGVSEEGFSRALGINVMLPQGKWVAVIFLAFIFGLGHVTNFFFSEFTILEALIRLITLVTFAILYGAIYLRVQNIWPLVIFHTLWDLSLVISGSAGPFIKTPMPIGFELTLAIISTIYAWYILKDVTSDTLLEDFDE